MPKGYPNNGKLNKGWIKKGQRLNPKTEFKKGEHKSINTEFKVGQVGYWTGKKRPKFTKEWIENMRKASKKRKHSKETRQKLSRIFKGEKSHFWKGGISPINERIRKSAKYKEWRKQIFKRDNYVCQECSKKLKGRGSNAHHIKPFVKYPKLRFDINNGLTLCRKCHKT